MSSFESRCRFRFFKPLRNDTDSNFAQRIDVRTDSGPENTATWSMPGKCEIIKQSNLQKERTQSARTMFLLYDDTLRCDDTKSFKNFMKKETAKPKAF